MEEKDHQGIPPIVWKFGIVLVVFFLFLCFFAIGYFHHASIQDFINAVIEDFTVLLKAVCIIAAGYYGYKFYDTVTTRRIAKKSATAKVETVELKNEMLKAKVQVAQQLPQVMKYAIDQGLNFKFEGLEVSSYLSNIHTLGGPGQQNMLPSPQDFVPEPYKFSDVLQNWQPTKDGILLAKKQELITSPIGEALCHTTFTGNTDAGKTNNERELLIQLLFLQQICYLCDRNYQSDRYDQKLDTYYDYRPIERLLAHPPIDKPAQCLSLLAQLYSELEDRRARRRHNRVQFKDIYLFMDELPAFCADEPEIMQYVGRFLRESRQYGIFFVGAAQDLLNQTLNNDNGAIRDNLLTNFYGGGDMTTARMVMNLPKGMQLDETGLGVKGCVYLRAKGAGIERVKARTALSDDLATQILLGDRAVVESTVTLPPMPVEPAILARQQEKRLATLSDAIEVWNECGEMGRPRLRKELQARGLECSDDRSMKLLEGIKKKTVGVVGG